MNEWCLKVAGVTFEDRQHVIERLKKGEKLSFLPDPANTKDETAVKIMTMDGVQIGFVPRNSNYTIFHNLTDHIGRYEVEVDSVTGGGDYNYGCNIRVRYISDKQINKTGHSFLIPYLEKSYNSLYQAKYQLEDLNAQTYDNDDELQDWRKAVSLYQQAVPGHIAHAEARLGNIYAHHQDDLNGFDTYLDAINYYTMAVEDGDLGYSYMMAKSLNADVNGNSTLGLLYGTNMGIDKPYELARRAYEGDTNARILLSVYYWRAAKNHQRAIECLYTAARQGDLQCLYNIADMLFEMDDELYKENTNEYKRYIQPEKWKRIGIQKLFAYFSSNRIFQEELIVYSSDTMDVIFSILEELLKKHAYELVQTEDNQSIEIYHNVKDLFVRIVNTSNSYVRGIDK